MKRIKFLLLIVLIFFISSCTGISEKLRGKNLDATLAQITGKTLNYSMEWVGEATLRVLDEMEIIVIESDKTKEGKIIKAATLDLDINIELKSVTKTSTHMKIDIASSAKPKERATAKEIFHQTLTYLLSGQSVETADVAEPLNFHQGNPPAE